MSQTLALFLVLALASSLGCSKKAESPEPEEAVASPGEAETSDYGLTEAQANEVPAKIGEETITVGEFAEIIDSKSPYIRARFEAPEIVTRNMEEGRIGLSTGAGFLDYEGMDVAAYRQQRLTAFVGMLRHMGLLRPPG